MKADRAQPLMPGNLLRVRVRDTYSLWPSKSASDQNRVRELFLSDFALVIAYDAVLGERIFVLVNGTLGWASVNAWDLVTT